MKIIFSLLLLLSLNLFAQSSHVYNDNIELQKREHHFTIHPWGTLKNKARYNNQWPFTPESIGHTIASLQHYGVDAYFHHGIDIRGEAGTTIKSATSGKVVNIENYASSHLYWEVAVLDDDGFLWQYHHVDRYSIPQKILDAYKQGTHIEAGTELGEIVYWPVITFGERFHHIHLNVLDKNLNYINPFLLLPPLEDFTAPKIKRVGIIQNGHSTTLTTIKSSDDYSLFVEASDYIQHTKFALPPYLITYSINGGKEMTVWRFNYLPGGTNNEKYLYDFYLHESCGNYECRRFLINLNFNRNTPRHFPTTPGNYTIKVIVQDFYGNYDQRTFKWNIID